MLKPAWRAVVLGLFGALLCGNVVGLFLVALDDGRVAGLLADRRTATVAVAAVAGFVTAVLTGLLVTGVFRARLRELAALTAKLRTSPHPGPLTLAERHTHEPGLTQLWGELHALTSCYRSALAEVVTVQESLEKSRTGRGRKETHGDRPAGIEPTHFVVGSSRHRMVARLAPNLHFIAATQPLRQFLTRTAQEILARSFLDVVHPGDADALRGVLRDALKDGEAHNVTFRVPPHPEAPAGARSNRHLQMDVMTAYDERGTPLHLRCHFVDITNQVVAEQELRRRTQEVTEANTALKEANEKLDQLMRSYGDLYQQAPVLYFGLDVQGNFVACNETMLRALGYSRQQLFGKPYTLLLPPDSRDAYLADPAVMQRPGDIETRWVKPDGTVIDVWIGTTTIHDAEGRFVRSRSAARDVTEMRRLADSLRQHAEELGRANAQLRRINQELEEYTYVVSHDLKEPLRTIETFSTFLADDYGPLLEGEGQEFLAHLTEASRRLGRLIDDLLTLSRTGRVIRSPRPFRWEPLLDTLRRDLRDLLARRNAVVHVEPDLPAALGDPERVMQLLANLVSNGLKYNRQERPEVTIGAVRGTSGAGGQVTLFVRDNGIGIDPVHHAKIFGIFKRLHSREEFEGTGAGLAICKRIVEAHGGRLWVESRLGEGATFLFTLPGQQPAAATVYEGGHDGVAVAVGG
ncbi:MAG: ATP-binding protein [Gemmataceae bacterium]